MVRLRVAKQRQMRWSDERAYVLALVRVADLNADPSPRGFAFRWGFAPDESQLLNGGMAIAALPMLLAAPAQPTSGRQQNLLELLK